MKRKMILLMGAVALALGLVGTPASWANSLTFQGVTFDLTINNAGDLDLRISGTGTGNWTGITSLDAFAINQYGTATGLAVSGWSTVPGGLNSGGCDGVSASFTCFEGSRTFNANGFDETFTVTKTDGAFSLSGPPSLKVLFDIDGTPCAPGCDLLSREIPGTSVPEPASLMLLGAGLAGLGIWRRKVSKS